jgi:hypothetical protein
MTLTHTHAHPSLVIALRTRTRALGTLNLAVALRGRSCGWGSCDRPRRTFVGRVRRPHRDTGLHFIELTIMRDAMRMERVVFRLGDARGSA